MLCCFPLTFWLLILAFRVGCVVSLHRNMNLFYHRNFPRRPVIWSWKLSLGRIPVSAFICECTHSIGFLWWSGCATYKEKRMHLLLLQPRRQGNPGNAVCHWHTFLCGITELQIQLSLPGTAIPDSDIHKDEALCRRSRMLLRILAPVAKIWQHSC